MSQPFVFSSSLLVTIIIILLALIIFIFCIDQGNAASPHVTAQSFPSSSFFDMKTIEKYREAKYQYHFGEKAPMDINNNKNNNNPTKKRSANSLSTSSNHGHKIRFHVDTSNLFNSSQICTQVGDVRDTVFFGDATCTSDDVLTTEKRDTYIAKYVPAVLKFIKDVILLKEEEVTPDGVPLLIPETACNTTNLVIPPEHTATGVLNTDYIVYLTAFPQPSYVNGWAIGCTKHSSTGRVVAAQIQIPPHKIAWTSSGVTEADLLAEGENPYPKLSSADRLVAKITLHELLHGMNFDKFGFRSANLIGGEDDNDQIFRRGKRVYLFNGSNALEAARLFYNCPTLDGVELEDEGLSALEHWEMRTSYGDLMNGVANRNAISNITLQSFVDLGHFVLSSDYEKYIEPVTFGAGFGCSLFYNSCNETAGGRDEYFCFDESMTDVCNFDYTAYSSYCQIDSSYSSDLPSWGQYFPENPRKGSPSFFLDDYCPRFQNLGAGECRVADRTATSDETDLGNTYSLNSRCFYTRNFSRHGASSSAATTASTKNTSCFESRCVFWRDLNLYSVQFRVSGAGSDWISSCLLSNETQQAQHSVSVSLDGYFGQVLCPPDASRFCFYNKLLGGLEIVLPPTTTTVSPPPPSSLTTTTTVLINSSMTPSLPPLFPAPTTSSAGQLLSTHVLFSCVFCFIIINILLF